MPLASSRAFQAVFFCSTTAGDRFDNRDMEDVKSYPPVRPGALILVSVALMAVGVVMVGSATAELDRSLLGPGFLSTPLGRQLMFVGVGIVVMVVTCRGATAAFRSEWLRHRVPQIVFALAVALLLAALLPGLADPHRGSHRWLSFTPLGFDVGFQPSELGKLAIIAFLAWLLAERGVDVGSFRTGFVPAALAVGLCVALVGKENFGTAALIACVSGGMLIVAGCRFRHLALLGGVGACGLAALVLVAPYRLARIAAYNDFWGDPQGSGYQPIQSLAAIASGGWFGRGLGESVQKYGYLPESHTDFVYAILCEETGVFGGLLVILLFGVIAWLGLRTMIAARTPFERLIAFGLTFFVTLQAALNMAVVTALTPTTGVPLPMLSAGGSGLLTTCVAIGILAGVAARGECQPLYGAMRGGRDAVRN